PAHRRRSLHTRHHPLPQALHRPRDLRRHPEHHHRSSRSPSTRNRRLTPRGASDRARPRHPRSSAANRTEDWLGTTVPAGGHCSITQASFVRGCWDTEVTAHRNPAAARHACALASLRPRRAGTWTCGGISTASLDAVSQTLWSWLAAAVRAFIAPVLATRIWRSASTGPSPALGNAVASPASTRRAAHSASGR